jgi:hypothetical protein
VESQSERELTVEAVLGPKRLGVPEGDDALSGKKLGAQAYGSAVPIGGGPTWGEDPRKVDPSDAINPVETKAQKAYNEAPVRPLAQPRNRRLSDATLRDLVMKRREAETQPDRAPPAVVGNLPMAVRSPRSRVAARAA